MKLERAFITPSPMGRTRQRLCGEVTYETGDCRSEIYWFDVPEAGGSQLSRSGNPWLIALLPLAMTLGESLHLTLPVDRQLRLNADDLISIWSGWYPLLQRVTIHCDHLTSDSPGGRRHASFFSGGIDSFFTLLRDEADATPGRRDRIDDLVLVWGFDIPLRHADAFARHRDRCAEVAEAVHRPLIDIATNLRDTRWSRVDWAALGFGSALAAVGLCLEHRWRRVSIASAASYANLTPWGSHPMTDALHSSSGTVVVHEGAAFDRVGKTRLVAQSDLALRHLHVCWLGRDDRNCSRCNKCYRTMTTLVLLGAAERATTFDWRDYDIGQLRTLFSDGRKVRQPMEEVQRLAVNLGRTDVAQAIDDGLQRSARIVARRARLHNILAHTRPLNRRLARLTRGRPLVWRIAQGLDTLGVT